MKTFHQIIPFLLAGIFLVFTNCETQQNEQEETEDIEEDIALTDTALLNQSYLTSINSLNTSVTDGQAVDGNVEVSLKGDQVIFTVNVRNLKPNQMYLQHLHGNKDASDPNCPDATTADSNKDGVVDITEAVAVAGVTMIPLHDNPLNMEIKSELYPVSDEEGYLSYEKTINLEELRQKMKENFDQANLDFSRFTYMIHGVGENADIPQTAQSVLELPASSTLPIGCGKLVQKRID